MKYIDPAMQNPLIPSGHLGDTAVAVCEVLSYLSYAAEASQQMSQDEVMPVGAQGGPVEDSRYLSRSPELSPAGSRYGRRCRMTIITPLRPDSIKHHRAMVQQVIDLSEQINDAGLKKLMSFVKIMDLEGLYPVGRMKRPVNNGNIINLTSRNERRAKSCPA